MTSPADSRAQKRATKPITVWEEISLFFAGKGRVHQSLRRLVKRLEKAEIPYSVVGGMAVYAHRYERTTDDVDVLLTPVGFEAFRQRFVPKNYEGTDRPRRFIDRAN